MEVVESASSLVELKKQPRTRWTALLVWSTVGSTIGSALPCGYCMGVINTPAVVCCLMFGCTAAGLRSILNSSTCRSWCQAMLLGELWSGDIPLQLWDTLWALIVPIYLMGGFLGSACAGWAANRFGRRGCFLLSGSLLLLPALMFLSCRWLRSVELLLLGRVVVGLGGGLVSTCLPMYHSEIAALPQRGTLGVCCSVGFSIGMVVSQIFTLQSLFGGEELWHIALSFYVVFMAVCYAPFRLYAESPKWLYIVKERRQEAIQMLIRLRGTDLGIEQEIRAMDDETSVKGTTRSLGEVLGDPKMLLPLILLCSYQGGQQLSGCSAVRGPDILCPIEHLSFPDLLLLRFNFPQWRPLNERRRVDESGRWQRQSGHLADGSHSDGKVQQTHPDAAVHCILRPTHVFLWLDGGVHCRYHVIRKLGWGHFSTVWLCWDLQEKRYVAIKIVKSAPHFAETAKDEIKILRTVRETDPSNPRRQKTVQMLDDFKISGVNGTHICMVFEVLGDNLLKLIRKSNYRGIPLANVKAITRQILEGLDYLHTCCKIIHTDIKPENVLLCVDEPHVRSMATEATKLYCMNSKMYPSLVSRAPKEYREPQITGKMSKNKKKKLKKKAKKRMELFKKQRDYLEQTGQPAADANDAEDQADCVVNHNANSVQNGDVAISDGEEDVDVDVKLEQDPEENDGDDEDVAVEQPVVPKQETEQEEEAISHQAPGDNTEKAKKKKKRKNKNKSNQPQSQQPQQQFENSTSSGDSINAGKSGVHTNGSSSNSNSNSNSNSTVKGQSNGAADGKKMPLRPKQDKQQEQQSYQPLNNNNSSSKQTSNSNSKISSNSMSNSSSATNGPYSDPGVPPAPPPPLSKHRPKREPALEECNVQVKIADLGNACWVDRHFTEDIQTRQYRSLEVILGSGYDTSADIWSTACMVFELATGDYLFEPHSGDTYSRDEDHLAHIIELLGPIPRHIVFRGTYAQQTFSRNGELRNITGLKPWGLMDVLLEKYEWLNSEAESFASFLKPMLEFDPAKRATAAECLQHPWLR
ncbi:GL20063 [Drosophila persimilis]|uniref:non-specific serine/threonine protein kinase n=1 Tax=Drosophila persimilis TaxID=7234 RepID=B4H8C9_DROPE|nr:GL20063 [Drosophila persimilis]